MDARTAQINDCDPMIMTPKGSPTQISMRALRYAFAMLLAVVAVAQPRLHAQPVDEDDATEVPASGPPRPWIYIGAYGGFSLVAYDPFLSPSVFAPTQTSLPPEATFTSGDGKGGLVGLLVEFPIGQSFNLGLRGGYQLHSGSLTQIYSNSIDAVNKQDNATVVANIQGTVETTFGHGALSVYGRLAPFSFPLYLTVGPTFLLPSQAEYNYVERIGAPVNAVFRDQRTTSRTLAKTTFSNATSITAVTAAIGYEFPLAPYVGFLTELQFQPLLGDFIGPLSGNQTWTGSILNVAIGIRFGVVSNTPPPPPPPEKKPKDTVIVKRPEVVPFDAKGVTANGLSDTIVVTKKKVKATEVHALLPYIFFDRDSAIIPARYVRLDPKNRRTFQVERLPRGSTLDIYYQLLNIVGQRIRDDRASDITITGCVSQFEKDTTLALRRAEAVRDYLVTVWRVPPKRLKVIARGLPANPSLSEVDTAEAARENQRVEIASANYVVERPVELPDSTFLAPIGTVRFIPPPQQPDTAGLIDGWALDVMVGDSLIKKAVTGSGQPPKQIEFQIQNRPDLDLRVPLEISSTLTIRDTLYQDMARLKSSTVTVRSDGEYEQERIVENGRYVDTYNLLLFSFDSAQATSFSEQGAQLIKPNLDSTSIVSITGHTDRIGLPYYNKALSQRRAEFAQTLLGLQNAKRISVQGMGEKELEYDNQFPEGRYYSRTVTVVVETPIPGQEHSERETRTSRKLRKAAEQKKARDAEDEDKGAIDGGSAPK